MNVAGEAIRTEGISDVLAEISRISQVHEPQHDESLESSVCPAFAGNVNTEGATVL